MALIRNFPVPSDRMAIISTLLNIEDAVVLEARMIATRIHEMIDGEDRRNNTFQHEFFQ